MAAIFGVDDAQWLLSSHFENVELKMFQNIYRIDDGEEIFDSLTSFPPDINAEDVQKEALRSAITRRLEQQDGILKVDRFGGLVIGK